MSLKFKRHGISYDACGVLPWSWRCHFQGLTGGVIVLATEASPHATTCTTTKRNGETKYGHSIITSADTHERARHHSCSASRTAWRLRVNDERRLAKRQSASLG